MAFLWRVFWLRNVLRYFLTSRRIVSQEVEVSGFLESFQWNDVKQRSSKNLSAIEFKLQHSSCGLTAWKSHYYDFLKARSIFHQQKSNMFPNFRFLCSFIAQKFIDEARREFISSALNVKLFAHYIMQLFYDADD